MPKMISIKIGKARVKAELAESFWKKAVGMMFRKSLSRNSGMLFPFSYDSYHAIWMLGMIFPIDILWLSSEKKVVGMSEKAQPWSPDIFYPRQRVRYVLELPAGFCKKHGIRIGSSAVF